LFLLLFTFIKHFCFSDRENIILIFDIRIRELGIILLLHFREREKIEFFIENRLITFPFHLMLLSLAFEINLIINVTYAKN
jgi:hypothetical protein